MVEIVTEIIAGLVILGCLILWVPHEVSIRELRTGLEDARREIGALKELINGRDV